ncbi:MAG: hypothetical protein LBD32_00345 [Cytophagales bacterium]|jgi:thymidylate synthase ThyX|nr:hypothetical protein [Cytophagales bacterium]
MYGIEGGADINLQFSIDKAEVMVVGNDKLYEKLRQEMASVEAERKKKIESKMAEKIAEFQREAEARRQQQERELVEDGTNSEKLRNNLHLNLETEYVALEKKLEKKRETKLRMFRTAVKEIQQIYREAFDQVWAYTGRKF